MSNQEEADPGHGGGGDSVLPPEELKEVFRVREVWTSLSTLLSSQPELRWLNVNGWM